MYSHKGNSKNNLIDRMLQDCKYIGRCNSSRCPKHNPFTEIQPMFKLEDIVKFGIYFLFNRKKLVYIGVSSNMINRINEHAKKESTKEFSHFSYIETREDMKELLELESLLIILLNPIYNFSVSSSYFININNKIKRREALGETFYLTHVKKYIKSHSINNINGYHLIDDIKDYPNPPIRKADNLQEYTKTLILNKLEDLTASPG